jgi:hypothetical protein
LESLQSISQYETESLQDLLDFALNEAILTFSRKTEQPKKPKASGSGWAQLSDGNCVRIGPVGHFESQLFSGGQFCLSSSLSGGIQSTLSNNNEQLGVTRAFSQRLMVWSCERKNEAFN